MAASEEPRALSALVERFDRQLQRSSDVIERNEVAFERNTQAFERNTQAFERNTRAWGHTTAAFKAILASIEDNRDETRAQTKAILRLLDRDGEDGQEG